MARIGRPVTVDDIYRTTHGTRPHRRTVDAARQRARLHRRQGAGGASARSCATARMPTGFSRDCGRRSPRWALPACWCRRGRRRWARLRRGRRGDGGDRPHPDAVAVLSTAVLAASALSRGGSDAQQARIAAADRRRLAAGGARGRRRRQAPPAARSHCRRVRSGNGFKLDGAKALRGRRPRRRRC